MGVKHTILTWAAVHLEGLLIRVDIELDTRPSARQCSNRSRVAPVEDFARIALDNVAGVVSSAVETAVAEQLRCGLIGADLLGR
jgi:uncharacterized membrane protein